MTRECMRGWLQLIWLLCKIICEIPFFFDDPLEQSADKYNTSPNESPYTNSNHIEYEI